MGKINAKMEGRTEGLELALRIVREGGAEALESYDSFSFREPTAFLIGNEGNGLSKEISDQAGQYLKIPMEGRVESLNASIAAALLMYEAHRQRSARL